MELGLSEQLPLLLLGGPATQCLSHNPTLVTRENTRQSSEQSRDCKGKGTTSQGKIKFKKKRKSTFLRATDFVTSLSSTIIVFFTQPTRLCVFLAYSIPSGFSLALGSAQSSAAGRSSP